MTSSAGMALAVSITLGLLVAGSIGESDDELTDEEMAEEECGRWDNGALSMHCTKAGSEECDWICPLSISLPVRRKRKR